MHNSRILHRDINPSNIFIQKYQKNDIQIKLGDFGIARVLSQNTNLVSTRIGTPYYLSPEIIEGCSYIILIYLHIHSSSYVFCYVI